MVKNTEYSESREPKSIAEWPANQERGLSLILLRIFIKRTPNKRYSVMKLVCPFLKSDTLTWVCMALEFTVESHRHGYHDTQPQFINCTCRYRNFNVTQLRDNVFFFFPLWNDVWSLFV